MSTVRKYSSIYQRI